MFGSSRLTFGIASAYEMPYFASAFLYISIFYCCGCEVIEMTDIFEWLARDLLKPKSFLLSCHEQRRYSVCSYWDMRAVALRRGETSSAITIQNYSHAATC